MIKASALSELLKNAIKNGIETVLISNKSGEILCIESKKPNEIITDDVSSIWIEYENVGNELNEKLNFLLIENKDGNIMSTNLYGYILTMKAGNEMQIGMLKKHLETLANYLNNVFKPFKEILEKKEDEDDDNYNN